MTDYALFFFFFFLLMMIKEHFRNPALSYVLWRNFIFQRSKLLLLFLLRILFHSILFMQKIFGYFLRISSYFLFFVITKAQKGNKIQIQSVEKKYKGAMTTTINRHMEYFFGF